MKAATCEAEGFPRCTVRVTSVVPPKYWPPESMSKRQDAEGSSSATSEAEAGVAASADWASAFLESTKLHPQRERAASLDRGGHKASSTLTDGGGAQRRGF